MTKFTSPKSTSKIKGGLPVSAPSSVKGYPTLSLTTSKSPLKWKKEKKTKAETRSLSTMFEASADYRPLAGSASKTSTSSMKTVTDNEDELPLEDVIEEDCSIGSEGLSSVFHCNSGKSLEQCTSGTDFPVNPVYSNRTDPPSGSALKGGNGVPLKKSGPLLEQFHSVANTNPHMKAVAAVAVEETGWLTLLCDLLCSLEGAILLAIIATVLLLKF